MVATVRFGTYWPRRAVAAAAAVVLTLHLTISSAADDVTDRARLLAGMPVEATSPIAAEMTAPEWQVHADYLGKHWTAFDENVLKRIRRFSTRNQLSRSATAFYPFSGPDFAYLQAFFPHATTYVMTGLERPATISQDIGKDEGQELLVQSRASLRDYLKTGIFFTKPMKAARWFPGVAPLVAIAIVRSGGNVLAIEPVHLDPDGGVASGAASPMDFGSGFRMEFEDRAKSRKTVLYFKINLADRHLNDGSFTSFCRRLMPSDTLIKGASSFRAQRTSPFCERQLRIQPP